MVADLAVFGWCSGRLGAFYHRRQNAISTGTLAIYISHYYTSY